MSTIIKKSSKLADITVYYIGGDHWSDDKSSALEMTSADAINLMTNIDGKNGGWTDAVVEEV